MKKDTLSMSTKTFAIICLMIAATIPESAHAGFIGDAIGTSQAQIFIKIVFGLVGAGIVGKVIWDFLDNQSITNGFGKLIGIGICVGAVIKPKLISDLFSAI